MRRIALTVVVCEAIAIGLLLAGRASSPPAAPAPQAPPATESPAEVVVDSDGERRSDSAPVDRVPAERTPAASRVTVFGVVTEERGAAIQGAHVFLDGNRPRSARVENGAYAIVDVLPGDYTLHCRAVGHRPHEEQLPIDGTADRLRRDFRLAKATVLRVRFVTPEGEELSDIALDRWLLEINVLATTEPPPEVFPGEGRQLVGLGVWRMDERELHLEVDPPVWVSAVVGDVRLAMKLVGPGDDKVDLVIAPGALDALACTLRFLLVDAETGQPITSGSFRVSSGSSARMGPLRSEAMTIGNLKPGPALLTATTDHEMVTRAVRLRAGQALDLGTLRLARARAIQGKVVDEGGSGVAAKVRAVPLEDNGHVGPVHRFERDTGPGGSFEEKTLGPRGYLLLARTEDGRAGRLRIEPSREDMRDVRVVLGPAGRVTFTGMASPMAMWTATITDERGHVVFRETITKRYPSTCLLPYGRYVLRVHDGPALLKQMPFTLDRAALRLEVNR